MTSFLNSEKTRKNNGFLVHSLERAMPRGPRTQDIEKSIVSSCTQPPPPRRRNLLLLLGGGEGCSQRRRATAIRPRFVSRSSLKGQTALTAISAADPAKAEIKRHFAAEWLRPCHLPGCSKPLFHFSVPLPTRSFSVALLLSSRFFQSLIYISVHSPSVCPLFLTRIVVQAPMMEFIDTHCDVFTGEDENKFEHRCHHVLIAVCFVFFSSGIAARCIRPT
jgi:hypothetical protein